MSHRALQLLSLTSFELICASSERMGSGLCVRRNIFPEDFGEENQLTFNDKLIKHNQIEGVSCNSERSISHLGCYKVDLTGAVIAKVKRGNARELSQEQ